IGDVILATPVVRSIRRHWPEARISFLTRESFSPLLANNPHLDEVAALPDTAGPGGLIQLVKNLRHSNWDLLIDLHNNLRSRVIRSLVPADKTIVYTRQALKRSLLIYGRMDFFGKGIAAVPERYARPLAGMGVELDEQPCELYPSERDRSQAMEQLRAGGPAGNRFLAIAPGSAWPTKRWPPALFAAAARELSHRYGFRIVLLGSAGDLEACRAVEDELGGPGNCLILAGRLGLMNSVAVVEQSSLMITNDTGLMHAATAVGTPVVAIFGCTTKHLGYFPYRAEDRSRVVEVDKGLWCRPCTKNGRKRCPLGHWRCMRDIGPGRVVEAAGEIFGRGI
ncbi:MAG: glycosyltransferase family 9 protein, partial [Gemmatimonadota bacterium]|nr:glycosyltransferase family 9 protein [Gemmatimonadota bacterium]